METRASGDLLDNGRQIQVLVGKMKCNDSLRLDCPSIDGECLPSQQMHRNCIPRKRIQRQDVKSPLGRGECPVCDFECQGKTCVAEYRFDSSLAVPEIGKLTLRNVQHGRIELVHAK